MKIELLPLTAAIAASLLLITHRDARADISKYACIAPASKRVEVITKNNACTGFKQLDSEGNEIRRVTMPGKVSGMIVASSDGRSVVAISSYFNGRIDERGRVKNSDNPKDKNPVVVYIYRDGKLVSSHRAKSFFKRSKLLSNSVSHINWVRQVPAKIVGKMFTIETTAYSEITLDVRSGAIVSQEDSPEWSECDVIGRGVIKGQKLVRAFDFKSGKGQQTIAFDNPSNVTVPVMGIVTGCFAQKGNKHSLKRLLSL